MKFTFQYFFSPDGCLNTFEWMTEIFLQSLQKMTNIKFKRSKQIQECPYHISTFNPNANLLTSGYISGGQASRFSSTAMK